MKKTLPQSSVSARRCLASHRGSLVRKSKTKYTTAIVADLLKTALAHHQEGRFSEADATYGTVLRLQPANVHALHLSSVLARQVGKHEEALDFINRALAVDPQNGTAHLSRAKVLHQLHRDKESVDSCNEAVRLLPDNADAYYGRGISLKSLGQPEEALKDFDRALQLDPNSVDAYVNRGAALYGLQQYESALATLDTALQLDPNRADAYVARGSALHSLHQYQAALESLDRAVALDPDRADAHVNRGAALHGLHQHEAALESLDLAAKLDPDRVETHVNRGAVLYELHQYQAALESLNRALQLDPSRADACITRGAVLYELHQHRAALETLDRALKLDPNRADVYINLGTVLHALRRYQEALDAYAKAIRLNPEYCNLYGEYLSAMLFACDWKNLPSERDALASRVRRGMPAVQPFRYLAIEDSPLLQKKVAEILVREKWPPGSAGASLPRWPRHEKIRVGYFSPDFRDHPVGRLMVECFELHDRSRFEVWGFSFSLVTDVLQRRIAAAMDRFLDVHAMTDAQIAHLAREHEIDIAIDLAGYTNGARPGIFARRAAPLQVNHIGYPGTMGADFIDYLIADESLVPETNRRYYSEKIVYLPDCFQANDTKLRVSETPSSRAEHGLPEKAFIYCCFNVISKITPETFARWMRILKRVEGSVLWLLAENTDCRDDLRREAQNAGVASERLIFAGRVPYDIHLTRQRLADLFLDTLPFNAGATASPALWAGLPILTCPGESFAGRMGASLLKAVGLPDLVAPSLEAYEDLAVELASTPGRIAALKDRLRENLKTAPLFNTPMFTRHLEKAYRQMCERYHSGLQPDHLFIERDPALKELSYVTDQSISVCLTVKGPESDTALIVSRSA
jgi:protein O-GlcNAc transferase